MDPGNFFQKTPARWNQFFTLNKKHEFLIWLVNQHLPLTYPHPLQPEIANTDETWADEKPLVSLNYMGVS